MGSDTTCSRVPFGPVTATFWPVMSTVTPLGTEMGARPILLTVAPPLPDRAQDLAADTAATGFVAREETL